MNYIRLSDDRELDIDTVRTEDYRKALTVGINKLVEDGKLNLKLHGETYRAVYSD